MNTPSNGTALITGASRGIGAVYADRLAKRGYDLILTARSETPLEELATRLRRETGRSVTLLPANLNDKADLAKVEATLRNDSSISLLVNNAGTLSIAPLLSADVDEMEDMIALNVTALTRLGFPQFVVKINNRKLLTAIGQYAGLEGDALGEILEGFRHRPLPVLPQRSHGVHHVGHGRPYYTLTCLMAHRLRHGYITKQVPTEAANANY